MSALIRVIAWLAVLVFLTLAEKYIPRQESAFRMVIAFTWLLWIFVGLIYGVRGMWRFLNA